MSGILITGCNNRHLPIALETLPGLRYWCEHNNWEFQFVPCPEDYPLHPYFWKWVAARAVAFKAPLVLWLDVDVILYNPERPLEKPECRIAFSQDQGGHCCGAWLAEGGQWLADFASTILTLGPPSPMDSHQDQSVVHYLSCWPGLHGVFGGLSHEIISNQDVDIKAVRPLFHHLWANQGVDTTVKRARKLAWHTPDLPVAPSAPTVAFTPS